jgi:exopolysaccharide biosynthesis polyprenyl glycosylphosphotransferase
LRTQFYCDIAPVAMAVLAGRREGETADRRRIGEPPSGVGSRGRMTARAPRAVARAGPAAHFRHLAQLADGVVLLAAFPLAYLAKTHLLPADLTHLYDPEVYVGPAALVALGTLLALQRRGAYAGRDVLHVSRMLSSVALAVGQALILAATAMFVFKLSHVSRLFVGFYGATAAVLLVAVRLAFRRIASRLRDQGTGAARVLLIGEGEAAERLWDVLSDEVPFGISVVAQLPASALARSARAGRIAGVTTAASPVAELLRHEAIDEVAVASGEIGPHALDELIEACDREGVALHLALDALSPALERASFSQPGGMRLLSVNPQLHSAWGRAVKRAIDLIAAPTLILITAPLWLVAAVAIKLDSPGPVFFVQERIGLNKRRFKMLKFRSMLQGSEHLRPMLHTLNEADGPIFKLRLDPRVTRVGRWLRRFDFDELPQLLNVLRGDMSLIGPRPMLASEITGFEPWQRKRFSMLPGITGLWQVSNRLGQSFLDGLQADLDYIDRWSLALDLEILLRTIPAVLRDRVAP